jgi:AmmeMemoRadiSam system protein A
MIAGVEHREPSGTTSRDAEFIASGGAFVTLHRRGRLRGCIGQIISDEPLAEVVAHCAKAAALEDPRFEPVQPEELAEIEIELSILSRPEPIAPEQIEAGKHGLMVSQGWRRGILLPQVATEFRWTAARLLEETCVKAGFDREAWRDPQTEIRGFIAEVFRESDFPLEEDLNPEGVKPRYSSST